jgi:alkanesulfonate monooxygenase SsuD/methylene tetrahydromethanopterin reductase-like flavin-dependent oxidoreductase (luciferase family)
VKIDLLLVPMGARYPEMRAAAVAAEDAGFDGVWTWDHLRDPARPDGGGHGVPEAWTTLSALAEATRRVTLGPLVLNVGMRHPGVLANMAATLQQVSGGRLLLGLGAGGSRKTPYVAEQAALGLAVEPDRERAGRVAEAIQVMRRLWAGDSSAFAGTHYRLDRPTGYLRAEPPPPVIVGGFGPRMAAIAGRHGDGFNTQARHPRLAELCRVAREAHTAAGRDPGAFQLSVFGGLSEHWLRANSPERDALERLGVHRLILLAEPPYDLRQIRAAGSMLGAP